MYLGIGTHSRYSQVAVVDDDGNLHNEIRLPNDRLAELAEQYAGGEAAVEASGHYRSVYGMLDEHLDVTLVNPSKNRLIAESTVKTDRIDAKRLRICSERICSLKATSRRTRSAPCGISSEPERRSSRNGQPKKPRQGCPQADRQRLR